MTAPGPVRDCQHPVARHVHGTHKAYLQDKCRCTPCRAANAVRWAAVSRAQLYGRWQPFVDAGPARAHVRGLMAAGMGWQRVARTAGVPRSTVSHLLYGNGRRRGDRMRTASSYALLGVRMPEGAVEGTADRELVDATATRLRVEGLLALGWPKKWIASQLSGGYQMEILRGATVQARTARQVAMLAELVGDAPGPSQRARAYYQRLGYLVPAAQDLDDDYSSVHVDPDSLVDEVAVARAAAGERLRLNRAERLEAVRLLARAGATATEVSLRLGMSGQHARRCLERVRQVAS